MTESPIHTLFRNAYGAKAVSVSDCFAIYNMVDEVGVDMATLAFDVAREEFPKNYTKAFGCFYGFCQAEILHTGVRRAA